MRTGALLDSALLLGAALLAFGTWRIFAPAGLIVGGVLLVLGVLLHARGAS